MLRVLPLKLGTFSILTTFCKSVTTFPPIRVDRTLSYLINFNALSPPKGNQYLSITGSSPITSWALCSILTTFCESVTSFPPIRFDRTLSYLLNFNTLSPPKGSQYLSITGSSRITSWALCAILTTFCECDAISTNKG